MAAVSPSQQSMNNGNRMSGMQRSQARTKWLMNDFHYTGGGAAKGGHLRGSGGGGGSGSGAGGGGGGGGGAVSVSSGVPSSVGASSSHDPLLAKVMRCLTFRVTNLESVLRNKFSVFINEHLVY